MMREIPPLPEHPARPTPGRPRPATSGRTGPGPGSHAPRAPEGVCVGMAGGTRHVLVPPNHQGVICHVHLGRGVVGIGKGEQLARELRHEHHHGRVWGEPLGAQLFPNGRPHLRQVTGGRGCAVEVDVGPHIPEDL